MIATKYASISESTSDVVKFDFAFHELMFALVIPFAAEEFQASAYPKLVCTALANFVFVTPPSLTLKVSPDNVNVLSSASYVSTRSVTNRYKCSSVPELSFVLITKSK